MSEIDVRQDGRTIGDYLANTLLPRLEGFLPLIIGLGIGVFLVLMFGRLPTKWVTFILFAGFAGSVLILVMLLTNKTRESILFAAIPTLPLYYSITPGFRENTLYSVMSNGFPIDLFDIGISFLAIGWLYQLWIKTNPISLRFPRAWLIPMGLLLLINIYSSLFIARDNFYSFSMIYSQLKCYLIAFFIANYIRDPHSLRLTGYAFAAILLTQGLIVMEQLFLGVIFTEANLGRSTSLKSVADLGTIYRVAGTLGHPNNMAMYLDLIIPWVGFQLVIEKHATRRVYLGIAFFLAIFAVVSSGSRGAWMGLLIGGFISIMLWYRKQQKSPIVVLFSLVIVVSILFATLFAASNTFRTRLTAGDAGAALVRVPLMEVALETINAHPLQGVGLANYTGEMRRFDRTDLRISSYYDQPVHNTFLLMAAETGIPSSALFLLILVLALLLAYRVAMRGQDEVAALGFGLFASLIGWTIHNQVNHTAPFTETTLWVLLGLLLAAYHLLQRQDNLSQRQHIAAQQSPKNRPLRAALKRET